MKKLTALLLITLPIFLGLANCKSQKENYYTGNASLYINDSNCLIKDFDKDKKADAIIDNTGLARFVVPGYEGEVSITEETRLMTSGGKLRMAASDFIDADNQYHFDLEKGMWKDKKSRVDEIKKGLDASHFFKSAYKLQSEVKKIDDTSWEK